jgi:SAM-dependent methyltransferase
LVAGLLHNRKVTGSDIDLLAGMLSTVKCAPKAADCYRDWRTKFEQELRDRFSEIANTWDDSPRPRPGNSWKGKFREVKLPTFPQLMYWFPPQLSVALATIAQAAHETGDPHFAQVALISLSASIISKWPNTLSYAMDIDHTRPHRKRQAFRLNRILTTYLARLDRSISCLAELHVLYAKAGVLNKLEWFTKIACPHDARKPLNGANGEDFALVVTSPPYLNAVDYPRAHRLSLCWMNGYAPDDLVTRQNYIGLRSGVGIDSEAWLLERPRLEALVPGELREFPAIFRRLTGFFADIDAVLEQVWRTLRPGGHAVFVIANNVVRGRRIAAHQALIELALARGYSKTYTDRREIAQLRRRFPVGPFGFDGPMTHEYVVVIRKPFVRFRRTRKEW